MDSIRVITISRQMGSQGDEIAAELADRPGWRRVGQDLINQAARTAGVPQVALAEIDEFGFLGLRPSSKEWQAYQNQVELIIYDLAEAGQVVIVGRGGQMVLRDRRDVLHVRIIAPLETRITRLQMETGISAEAAQARLEASDKARDRYVRRSYKANLDDPTLYHLVINTGLLGVDQAVRLLLKVSQNVYG